METISLEAYASDSEIELISNSVHETDNNEEHYESL